MSAISLRPILLILLLWLAGLGAAGQFAKIAVPFEAFRALYPDMGAGLGWLLSVISVVGIALGMTAGILAGRLGYFRALIAALVVGAAMSVWQAMLPGYGPMLVSRLIEGGSHLVIVVVAPTLIAQFSSERYRGLAMTLWSTFFGVAFALVAWVGLPLVATRGIASLLLAHGVVMIVLAGCLMGAVRLFDLRLTGLEAGPGAALNLAEILRQHGTAYRSPDIAAPAIGWLFYTVTFVAILAILPLIVPAHSHASLIGLLPLVSIVSALVVVSWLLTRVSAVTIVVVGFVLAAGVMALALTGLPATLVLVGLFAVLGLVQGASFAAIAELNTTVQDRALASGALAQMGNLGNTIGTPLLLAVLAQFGMNGLLGAICALYVAGALGHLIQIRRRRSWPGVRSG